MHGDCEIQVRTNERQSIHNTAESGNRKYSEQYVIVCTIIWINLPMTGEVFSVGLHRRDGHRVAVGV